MGRLKCEVCLKRVYSKPIKGLFRKEINLCKKHKVSLHLCLDLLRVDAARTIMERIVERAAPGFEQRVWKTRTV